MPEFHNLSEIALNEEGQSWGNLGYWHTAQSYSNACRALARLLADKTELNAQSRVMDLGFGCGDQLQLWLDEYQVEDVRGINNSTSQTELARTKLETHGYVTQAGQLEVGNASDQKLWQRLNSKHIQSDHQINKVLALDCAYHFSNKREFFSLASKHLASGGQIGLTDFVLCSPNIPISSRLKMHTMFALSRIPKSNIVATDAYSLQLQQAGFKDIEITDISEQVMPKFRAWLNAFKRESSTFHNLPWHLRHKYHTTAKFLDWAYVNSTLKYVVITAYKK